MARSSPLWPTRRDGHDKRAGRAGDGSPAGGRVAPAAAEGDAGGDAAGAGAEPRRRERRGSAMVGQWVDRGSEKISSYLHVPSVTCDVGPVPVFLGTGPRLAVIGPH